MRVRLTPRRSATIPLPTRPTMEDRPETPRIEAAAMLPTPRSMAWETRWKIGPECAAQHAKCVSAMAQMGHDARICPTGDETLARPLAQPGAGAAVGDGLRKSAQGITISQARSPRTTKALRQSSSLMSQRESGDSAMMPSPLPADTMAAAMPRRSSNHRIARTVRGT